LKSFRNAIDALAGEAGDEVELPQISLCSGPTRYGLTSGTFPGTISIFVQQKKNRAMPGFPDSTF